MIHRVQVSKLSSDEFAAYGSVVQIPIDSEPEYQLNGDLFGNLGVMRFSNDMQVALGRLPKRPFRLNRMYRHFHTMELIVPMGGTILLPVAEPGDMKPESGPPPLQAIRVFEITHAEAVILNVGVWHCTPFPVSDAGVQVVLYAFAVGTEDDLVAKQFADGDVVDAVLPVS